MFYISNFLKMIQHKVTDGSEYLWDCFGTNARFMESTNDDYSIECIFDYKTNRVYQIMLSLESGYYRWTDLNYISEFKKESDFRLGANYESEVNYIEVESLEDFLTMVRKAVNIKEDTTVELNLTDDEVLGLMKIAHERDITLNQLVNDILREYLNLNKDKS